MRQAACRGCKWKQSDRNEVHSPIDHTTYGSLSLFLARNDDSLAHRTDSALPMHNNAEALPVSDINVKQRNAELKQEFGMHMYDNWRDH